MVISKLDEKINYKVIRSRRRSIALVVKEDGSVEIRCPGYVTKKQIEEIACGRTEWIRKQQQKIAAKIELPDIEAMSEDEIIQCRLQLHKRIDSYMSNYSGLRPVGFTIRKQTTRWGSCSSKGTLSFNWRLMLAPPRVLDYVVVHELCHITHMNHSKDFWNKVESIMPDYKIYRDWLKKNGSTLTIS